MARAITKKAREVYVLLADRNRPTEEQTGFILGPVPYIVQQDVVQMVMAGQIGASLWVTRLLKACLKGVEDARPLRDQDGDPVPFAIDKNGVVKDSWLENLTFNDRAEIAKNRLSTFLPDEEEEGLSDLEKSEPSLPTD